MPRKSEVNIGHNATTYQLSVSPVVLTKLFSKTGIVKELWDKPGELEAGILGLNKIHKSVTISIKHSYYMLS